MRTGLNKARTDGAASVYAIAGESSFQAVASRVAQTQAGEESGIGHRICPCPPRHRWCEPLFETTLPLSGHFHFLFFP